MTEWGLYCVIIYLVGVFVSYVTLTDLRAKGLVKLFALGSWLTFICYLIACTYNDFDE